MTKASVSSGAAAPLVLGFDTSSQFCCAALLRDKEVLSERGEDMQRGQAEALMQFCQDILFENCVAPGDLDAIGVGVGPGNFTGIRISVAAARGLSLGLSIPAVGVSTFDALRFGTVGACACSVDARRGQAYLQVFHDANTSLDPVLINKDAVPAHSGCLIGAGGESPVYSRAVAIARIAGERYKTATKRPAPLYLRPADAAPARDASPRILT